MRRLLFLLVFGVLLLVLGVLACGAWIEQSGKGAVYDRAEAIPPREVGLVLGTSEKQRGGGENPYFQNRMDAAARLFRLGKVKRLLLSGDRRQADYNEPAAMKRALVSRGIPARALSVDNAGVRTLDSVVRARQIFGLARFTIISQREHAQRALLIARHYHIDAIAYAADDVPFQNAVRAHVHEWLAQVAVIFDLYVLHTAPEHPARRQTPR